MNVERFTMLLNRCNSAGAPSKLTYSDSCQPYTQHGIYMAKTLPRLCLASCVISALGCIAGKLTEKRGQFKGLKYGEKGQKGSSAVLGSVFYCAFQACKPNRTRGSGPGTRTSADSDTGLTCPYFVRPGRLLQPRVTVSFSRTTPLDEPPHTL